MDCNYQYSLEEKSFNKYDVMIFFIIVSLAFGYLGGYLYPVRVIVLLLLPFLFKNMRNETLDHVRPFMLFFIFWSFYNIMSLLWVPQLNRAIFHTFLMIINYVMFLEILVFSEKARFPHNSIANGWLIAFFLTSFIAIWELYTGNHLSNAKDDYLGREDAMEDLAFGTFVAVGFYNLNTYCTYILEVFPFVLYILSAKTSIWLKFVAIYSALMCVLFVLVNGSRGSSLGLGLMFLIYLFLLMRGGKRGLFFALLLAVMVIFVFFTYGDILLSVIMFRIESSGMVEDNSRLVLWAKSMELFFESFGFGTGVGSMVPAMHEQGNSYYIFFSHNLFVELLMQFGLVISLFFYYYLYKLFVKAREVFISSNKIVLYSSLLCLPLYSIVNSEYTHLHFVWCYFACIYIYSQSRIDTSILPDDGK